MTSFDEPFLVREGGPDNDQTIPIEKGSTAMGRQTTNDVIVPEVGVSRKHAEIVEGDGQYHLRDLETTNGTFVNGKRITNGDHLLQDGDSIRLGTSEVALVFRSPTATTLELTLTDTVFEDLPPVEPGESTQPATMVLEVRSASGPPEPDDLYEGTVRLNVKAEGGMSLLMDFTKQLRERPEFRLLRMANNKEGGVDLVLALREPLSLRQILSAVEGVVDVSPTRGRDFSPESPDAPLTVVLRTQAISDDRTAG